MSTSAGRGPRRPFDPAERRVVWTALSDLFLDTDTSALVESIALRLSESPFEIDELEEILVDEVYPTCRPNLLAWPGGEWAGFDPDWLERKILERRRSPFRFLHAFNLGRLTVHASGDWRRIKRRIRDLRG